MRSGKNAFSLCRLIFRIGERFLFFFFKLSLKIQGKADKNNIIKRDDITDYK